jgi:hypothetical protein
VPGHARAVITPASDLSTKAARTSRSPEKGTKSASVSSKKRKASPTKVQTKSQPGDDSDANDSGTEVGRKTGPLSLKEALPDFMHDDYDDRFLPTIRYIAMCLNHPWYYGGEASEPKLIRLLQHALEDMYPDIDYRLENPSSAFSKVCHLFRSVMKLLISR